MKTIKIFTISIFVTLSMNLSAQIKVNTNGKVGVATSSPARTLQVGSGADIDYDAFLRLRSWWTYSNTDWKNHSRLEFTDQNFGFGAGRIDGADRLYSYIYDGYGTTRTFSWFRTTNGNSDPNSWFALMELNDDGHLTVNKGIATYYMFSYSDERLKENIENISTESNSLYALTGVKYSFKPNTGLSTEIQNNSMAIDNDSTVFTREETFKKSDIQYGLIAQEVKELYPDLVSEDKDGILGINYDGFIPLLIEALKEQRLEIENLKSSSSNLKSSSLNTDILESSLKKDAVLYQNTPNPFTENTEIKYFLAEDVKSATLYIYNMQGNQVKSISLYNRGEAIETIFGSELQAGMYIYALIADGKEVSSKRMILTD